MGTAFAVGIGLDFWKPAQVLTGHLDYFQLEINQNLSVVFSRVSGAVPTVRVQVSEVAEP